MIVLCLFSSEDHTLVRREMGRLATLSLPPGNSPLFQYSYLLAQPLATEEEHITIGLLDCTALSEATAEQQAAHLGMAVGEARSIGKGRLLICAIYRSSNPLAAASQPLKEYPANSSLRPSLQQLSAVRDQAQNRSYYSDLAASTNRAVATAEIAYNLQQRDISTATVSATTDSTRQSLHYRLTADSASWWRVTTSLVAPHQQRGWVIESSAVTEEAALLQQLLILSAQELLEQPSAMWEARERQLVAHQIARWSLSHHERHQLQKLLQRYIAQHGSFPTQLLQESHSWQRFRHQIDAA